jgi:integrase
VIILVLLVWLLVTAGVDVAGGLEEYRRHLRAQAYAAATVRAKVDAVERIAREARVDPRQLAVEHVEAYLAARSLAPWSRRKYLAHLQAWARWAALTDPTAGLRRPPAPRGVPKPIGEDDLAQLLAGCSEQVRAWVVLGAFAGLRSAETAALRGADLSRQGQGPVLLVRGKGGHVDAVPAGFVVLRELAGWRERAGAGRLWPDATAQSVQRAIRRAGERVGVRVSSHMLRHRFGTQLYAHSHDLLLTQRLMRHASPATTAGYAKVSDVAAAQLVDTLPLPGLTRPRPGPADPLAAGP